MIYRFFLFLILYEASYFFATITAEDNSVYRIPLVRRKSPLQMLIKDPNYMNRMKIKTNHPTNENITLFKYLDSEYYAEILIGKPGQKFTVIFDTTWGDMWIPSIQCPKRIYPFCETKHLYDSNASSTHKSIEPKPFEMNGLVGNLTCDTVRLAHLNVSDLVFAEIREVHNSDEYKFMHADGVIGLAYNTLARTTKSTFFYKLIQDKKISQQIFSLYVNRDASTTKGGMIFLGGIEPKHIQKGETFIYMPVLNKNYWQITMNQFSIQLNKTYAQTFCHPTCQVILDSTTNTIGVPKDHVLEINNLIGAVEYLFNRYRVSCTKISKLPTITLRFGNKDFQIKGRHYIQKIENDTDGMICLSAFSDSGLSDNLWSLGGAFLSSVYTTFDLKNNRVGIAVLR